MPLQGPVGGGVGDADAGAPGEENDSCDGFDRDGDGVSDDNEPSQSTDPEKPDTDLDGYGNRCDADYDNSLTTTALAS